MFGAPVAAADVCHDECVGGQVEPFQACVAYSLMHQRGGADVSKPLDLLNKKQDFTICKCKSFVDQKY